MKGSASSSLLWCLGLLLVTDIWHRAECFVNSPKIISKDGNLIFESGANRNISFRLTGTSRLTINEEYDVLDLLLATGGGSKKRSGGGAKDEWSSSEDIVDVRELADQLADFQRRAFGPNGLNVMLRQQQNRTRGSLALMRRFQTRLRAVENKVDRMKTQLEANGCASGPCENGGTCYNTYSGFRCQCRPAFEGTKCEVDVNECALYEGTDLGCQNGAQCQNQFGTYSCLCQQGWHGMHCTQRRADCSQASAWELCGHGSCVPSSDDAGYRCICDAGWKTNGLTPVCGVDVDECNEASAAHTPCSTKCINLPGSFTCAPCAAGLTGNGVSCRDVDECQTNNGGCSLSPRVDCINTYGSHICGQCPVGWTGDGHKCERVGQPGQIDGSDSKPATIGNCADRSLCYPGASCYEISGTAVCACPTGMVGFGIGPSGCINGTARNCQSNPCKNNGICVDSGPSNYTCMCRRGFRPPNCEPLPSPCDINPCKNGGSCRPTTAQGGDGFVCQCLPGYRDRLCSTRFSSCNALLVAASGRLKYPPEGTGYEHNAQCAWVIRTNESLVLNVTFHSFDLEDATECRFDWLQLNDGRSAAAQIIGRYCGNHLPHGGNIISSGNQLYLWFRSDNSTAKEGFDLTWTSMQPRCGGKLEFETHGTLASPGSPGNYPKNRDCRWTLVAPIDKRIKLTFFSLQLERHDNCNFDYVQIKDTISGRELAKYCSSGQPAPLLLPTHQAEILFHSDADGSDTGFQLHYSVEERIPGCGGVFTAREGTISGASGSGVNAGTDTESQGIAMGDPVSCEYEIRSGLGELIAIQMEHLELGPQDCLEVLDVTDDNVSALQAKICGSDAARSNPPAYTSLYNRLKIKFYASAGLFRLRYHAACSFTFDSPEGTLMSTGYPDMAKGDRSCSYTIRTAPNTVISVRKIDFQLKNGDDDGDDEDCLTTSLRINDGINRQILGPYCGNKQPPEEFLSKTNYLQYQLTTDADTQGRGFKFEYRAVPVADDKCGGVHTRPGDNIRLPVNEGEYANDVTCYWVIMAPPNKVIRLHWISFHLESSMDCSFDYVEIFDRLDAQLGSSEAKPLAKYCSDRQPEDLLSHSRQLVIKFTSDYSESDGGFELSYTFEDMGQCGGHIHASAGELSSPGYPMNYSNGLDCNWRLTGTLDHLLEIQVEVFDLELSANCSADYLEVMNGGGTDSPLIGRFCGTTIPTRIPSFSHELTLRLHTDAANSGRGFRLRWRIFGSGCGGRLRANAGVIASPRYPNNYPHMAHCEWHLTVHQGSGITLLIEDMELESLSDCYYDNVKIYSGLWLTGQKPDRTLCQMPTSRVIQVDSNEATIVFDSDSSNAMRGFRISYIANCVRNLTATSGTIESLNYMEPFTEDMPINCSWRIQAPKGNSIRLEVSHMQRHEEHLPTALVDGLYIVDGKNTQTLLAPKALNASGEVITVVHNASTLSFLMDYRVVGCLEELRGESGSFHSPNYPGMYPNNMECYWLINVERDHVIKLTITDMDLEESVNCTKDALTVSNHVSEVQVHERHCGSNKKLILTSSGNKMHVRFISDGSHNGQGFQAKYIIMKTTCGGTISTRNGVIQSPNYPGNYPEGSHCEWQVEVSKHHRIVFEVQDLDLEAGYSCSWDYLEAFEVNEDETENRQLFKICDENEDDYRSSVMSTTNLALVRFVSDDSVSRKGFRLRFHESCGQTMSIDDTDFEYIQMGRQASRNESCLWVLQAQEPSKHIILTITHIKLREEASSKYPTEGDCMPDGVQIYEGTEVKGTPRLRFCGSHPPALISNGQALTISVPLLLVEEFEGHYMTMDTVCGSYYNALSGRFSTPYYPSSYPVNIECTWVLEANVGNSLSVTLESMDLEESEGCNRDYLEVRDESESGKLIGVYCGNQLPGTIHSRGSVWMTFKSDDDNVGEGFMVSYSYEHHNELNGTDGIVESPHYPSQFKDLQHPYSWRITVDKDYVVVLSILHLRDVDQAHIQFYDGYSDIGARIEVTDLDEPVRSSSNVLYFTASRGPFRLSWERLSKDDLLSNRTAEAQMRLCGNELIAVGQWAIPFHSPGYPEGYDNGLKCSWSLVASDPAMHTVLSLSRVDLEVFGGENECIADYIQVSSGSDLQHWSEMSKLCSLRNETSGLTFHGKPHLRLEFITDGSINQTGFNGLLRTACGSEIVSAKGQVNITDVVRRSLVRSNECVWTLKVRQGKRIKIDFPQSQLQNSNLAGSSSGSTGCDNFLVLRNGHDEDSPFLGHGKYCEDNIQDTLETTSNRAYVKFRFWGTPRFLVTFRFEELSHACSRRIDLKTATDEELISSPYYPNLPHPHSECVWIVTAPPQHRIMLHFRGKFDLTAASEESGECQQEYVTVIDGSTELRPELGRFCGQRSPDTIYSSGSQLRIHYYTDVTEPHIGFQASLKLARCGGTYHSPEGVIVSPPRDLLQIHREEGGQQLEECVYTIELEKGNTIELHTEFIKLPAAVNGNCSQHSHLLLEEMEAYGMDGDEHISDRLMLCGSENHNLIGETNKIVFRYRLLDGMPSEDQGFRIVYGSVGSRCGETIIAMQGVLQTPGYPDGVRSPTLCVWKLEVPKGRRVRLEIVDFNTGASNATRVGGVMMNSFRGRLTIANDHKMQSILGRYTSNPPESVISSDNTMGIDTFLLPINRHRGFRFRFSAYGTSLCQSLQVEENVTKQMTFERTNITSLVHCSYDIEPPVNSTVLILVKEYNTSSVMMRNTHLCSLLSPLKLNRLAKSEAFLPRLLCDFESKPQRPAIRVPFPIQLTVSAGARNSLTNLVLEYSMQACGGVHSLEPGDNMTVRQPSGMEGIQGAIDCAWAIGSYADAGDDDSSLQDIQLEVSLRVNLPTPAVVQGSTEVRCQHHYLTVYNGPDQNSPKLGEYCQEDVAVNMVVERGLFLEYHADHFTPNATFNVSIKYGSGCGGRLKHPYRSIEFYEQYKNNVECIWEVEAEAGYHIGLSFLNRFFIEDSPGCTKDYLLVQQRDDANGNWTDLRRICGRSAPDQINSTARFMQLIFRSDGDTVGHGFFAKFDRNCGGPLYADDEEQMLSSPNYPLGYDKGLYCNWTIVPRNPEAARGVLVSFVEFDLEHSPMVQCLFDNLTVITRDDKDRVNEVVLCGVKQNHEYRALQSINLVLRSDNSFAGRGFLLRYSTRLCGGVVSRTGVVESPRQHTDNSLPPSSDCYWNLTAPEGHKLTVKFQLLDFEPHTNCAYDGVEVFAGAVPLERERRGRFCGRINEDLPVISIPQNRGLIHSYSDDRDPSRGFRALVRIVPNCDEQILINGTTRYIFTKFSKANGYDPNLDCQVVFRVQRDQQIRLEFRSFHVELSTDCRKDYVELRDGAGPFADIIGRFCGQDEPPMLTTTRHTLFLRFVTDDQVNDSGFEVAISPIPRLCGSPEVRLASDGVKTFHLNSPSREPGGNYGNGVACFWKFVGDKPLSLHFSSFDLEGPNANGSCVADYLKVYNSEDAQLVERGFGSELIFNGHTSAHNYINYATEHVYCGNVKPDTYYANSNEIYIKFRSNSMVTRPGFVLQIMLASNCERHYDGLQGRVRVSETSDCDIMIQAPVNHTLSLYYTELIFSSYDCDVEHLEVYDKTNRTLQRVCAYVDVGKSLFTYTDQLRLHVTTGSYLSSLDLTYLASPVEKEPGCGGQFYNTEGVFANPFYPANVRNNSDCRWTVRVPSNNKVLLTFEAFNLGSKSTCHTDYLQILEQDDAGEEREVRRFCGEDNPKVYKSPRSQVVIRFHKTVNYDGVGWVIRFAGVYSNYQIPRYLLGAL
ncbi:LOW QUALITY PROTEIN: cubilin homolog [Drosophila serrata]|uniref:LOW QUALITY PROTEIN: cubilin homolog n=1 Tax=Drosophila serrata TaxID=7274 RepID=UPI000A1D3511|nr:LOW QUALITY PROTEIN: cubilin homolog [Drosophila serrata]